MSTKKTFAWQAPEFKHYEKNAGWYVTLIAISVLIFGFFIIEQDIFAAITTAILAALVVFFSRQKPEIVDIEINHSGINFHNLHYPFKQIKSFWIVNNQNHKTLNVITTTYINNVLIFELQDQDADEIREHLLKYLPEHEEIHETFSQRIMHRFKF